MSRAAALRRPPAAGVAPDVNGRLALLEQLLIVDEVEACAQRALEWLGRHAGVTRAVCLLAPLEHSGRVTAVAGLGVSLTRLERFSLDLDERDHPLVRAMLGPGPVSFAANGGDPRRRAPSPVGDGPFEAIPLCGFDARGDLPAGLLVLSYARGAGPADARWAAEMLGPRLAQLRERQRLNDAERGLRHERGLLYSIINAVTDPILLTDTEGRILIANARAEALLASGEEESEGRRRAVALNNMLFSSALSRRAIEDVEPWRHELLLVDPTDGSDLLFELLSTVTSDPREGTGIVSILRNVTDLRKATEEIDESVRRLRQAEAEARAERDRLDLIIDSVADPIVVSDPNGNIVMMNAPGERLFTVADGDVSAEERRAVQANDAHFSSFVSNLFFEGDSLRRSGAISLLDPRTGDPLPVEAISGKIVSEHGEVNAVVTILHDRTEEIERARLFEQLKLASAELEQKVREATAELVRQNELLRRSHIEVEQASAAKSQFLANMSHEFRTPLNAILGYTSMLLKGVSGELAPNQRRNLSRIDSNAHHLLSIINDILDISRIEAGKMPLTVTEFDVAKLVTEVFSEVEPLIARAQLSVTHHVEEIPTLVSDRQKVKQIVINLLTNALKFTREGSVTVRVGRAADSEEFWIAVEDTGIGIPEDEQAKIFDDFRQADNSTTREYTGAGLGLAICRRLAGMLSGRITLASEPGAGSTFTVWLPRVPR